MENTQLVGKANPTDLHSHEQLDAEGQGSWSSVSMAGKQRVLECLQNSWQRSRSKALPLLLPQAEGCPWLITLHLCQNLQKLLSLVVVRVHLGLDHYKTKIFLLTSNKEFQTVPNQEFSGFGVKSVEILLYNYNETQKVVFWWLQNN